MKELEEELLKLTEFHDKEIKEAQEFLDKNNLAITEREKALMSYAFSRGSNETTRLMLDFIYEKKYNYETSK